MFDELLECRTKQCVGAIKSNSDDDYIRLEGPVEDTEL